jgi:hypothetical protein
MSRISAYTKSKAETKHFLCQGHLHHKLKVPPSRLTFLGRETNPGLRGGRRTSTYEPATIPLKKSDKLLLLFKNPVKPFPLKASYIK